MNTRLGLGTLALLASPSSYQRAPGPCTWEPHLATLPLPLRQPR